MGTVAAVLVLFAGGIGWVLMRLDTWQTDCYVRFEAGRLDEARAFELRMRDVGYDPDFAGHKSGRDATGSVTVTDGGLFGDGAGVEEVVKEELPGFAGGHLEADSCLTRPYFD